MTDCYACRQNAKTPGGLPPRERVFDDGNWRVVHAFGSAIPGWLVVVCRRHVTSMSRLTPPEADTLGPLLAALSTALETVFPARKAYVAFLAEAEGFEHLHVHVVPREEDMPRSGGASTSSTGSTCPRRKRSPTRRWTRSR
jgi:diadenosine tetraphosphate (Ap4A) HIT family hydrolase